MAKKHSKLTFVRLEVVPVEARYEAILTGVAELLEASRRASVRSVNAIMAATYWEIGRWIVQSEQDGEQRAEYGAAMVKRLAEGI